MPVDDYYALFGVSPDATGEDIRSAYRAKRDDLAGRGTDEARGEASRLNRAWNVLSDPYQRGRYDEQLARAREEGGGEGGDEGSGEASAKPAPERPARRRLFDPAPGRERAPRPVPQPTIEYPAGTTPAPARSRVFAMVIDLLVLVVLFIGLMTIAAPRLVDSRYPEQMDALDRLSDELSVAEDERDDLDTKADGAEDAADEAEAAGADEAEKRRSEAATARGKADEAQDRVDEIADEAERVSRDLQPFWLVLQEGFFLVGLVYLVVPSALTGQTLGKRLRAVRVVRLDGSPLGWRGALVRYGLIVLGTNIIFLPLQVLAVAVALFVVMGWMRNADQQGLHDRVAKTLVVAVER